MIYLNAQYNGEFLPNILLLTQAPIVVWFDSIIIVYYYYLLLIMYCIVFCFCWVSWPGMSINVSVQYNGGSLLDIILLTQGYYHWGTHSNAMERLYF